MTTSIIQNNIVINDKTSRYRNLGVVKREVEDIIYLGKELEFINTTECNASSPWVEIKFKGEKTIWVERYDRIFFIINNLCKGVILK